eukprot:jgi/Chlat1/44/ChrspC237719S08584
MAMPSTAEQQPLKKMMTNNGSPAPVTPARTSYRTAEFTPKTDDKRAQDVSPPAASTRMPSASRRVHPIQSLNPYQGGWTIRARVTSKGDKRTFRSARGEGSVFTLELTDEQVHTAPPITLYGGASILTAGSTLQGTQIQATAWRDTADKLFDILQLHKVYFITNGQLKPADRRYSSLNNHYEMTFTHETRVEECLDADAQKLPDAVFKFVPIEELGLHLPKEGCDIRRVPLIDVVGVVQKAGPLSSIKRKSDGTELMKRDITITDESSRTVQLTLWNKLAEDAATSVNENDVVAVRGVRVNDFNGVSLSTVTKSQLTTSPGVPEAEKLRRWWDSEGSHSPLTPLNAGMPSASKGMRGSTERKFIKELTAEGVGQSKPEYFTLKAKIVFIKPDQQLWYNACPKEGCNKKVTDDQGGKHYCEGCQQSYPSCQHRYIVSMRVADATGDSWVVTFHDQAVSILKISADVLADLRQADEAAFKQRLQDVVFNEYIFRVSVVMREYNNEMRQRVTIVGLQPVDYVAESNYLLQEIAKYS